MGDGINDAPALHAADAGISVEGRWTSRKEAADFVLLQQDLHVLRRGIEEGRRTFANTLKYILTTTSANLGNMISMAAASAVPAVPAAAGRPDPAQQPPLGHAGDRPRRRPVDPELVARRRGAGTWPPSALHGAFGLLSSLFDGLTFGALLWLTTATGPALFRTGWFVESLLTELVIALVVRTRHDARADPDHLRDPVPAGRGGAGLRRAARRAPGRARRRQRGVRRRRRVAQARRARAGPAGRPAVITASRGTPTAARSARPRSPSAGRRRRRRSAGTA
jgi:hypothetical protein